MFSLCRDTLKFLKRLLVSRGGGGGGQVGPFLFRGYFRVSFVAEV